MVLRRKIKVGPRKGEVLGYIYVIYIYRGIFLKWWGTPQQTHGKTPTKHDEHLGWWNFVINTRGDYTTHVAVCVFHILC